MATRWSTGEGTVYARKNENGKALKDSWVAQITVDGKRRTFTGRTRKEASARLEEFKRQAGIAVSASDILNECGKYAIFPRELIAKNPMIGVTMPSKELFESKDIRYFSDDEIARFKEAALATWSNEKPVYPLGWGMVLMLNTGVRIGEGLARRWSDYDADAGLLHVSGNLVRVRDRSGGENVWMTQRQTPKTAKGRRSIPVNASVKAAPRLRSPTTSTSMSSKNRRRKQSIPYATYEQRRHKSGGAPYLVTGSAPTCPREAYHRTR